MNSRLSVRSKLAFCFYALPVSAIATLGVNQSQPVQAFSPPGIAYADMKSESDQSVRLIKSKKTSPIELLDTKIISWKEPLYYGWSTVARRANGELLLVYSGGREGHVCPFGRVELMRSKDGGQTWGWPQVLYDGPIDDRDAGVFETSKGTILVTTFTSLAYEPILKRAEAAAGTDQPTMKPEILKEWQAVHGRIDEAARKKELGCFVFRSEDGGVNWDERYRVPCNSPHGPTELQDGKLIYAGKALWGDEKVGVWQSVDDGKSWDLLSPIEPREGDTTDNYHELHAVQAANGDLIVQIRNHNKNDADETLQCESSDGGKTWTPVHSIGVWGLPSHLMKMKSGRLVMTYGHRRAPLGNQMRYSDDNGKTWSESVVISGDGVSGDLGYPATVEGDDGTMVTVWYEKLANTPNAQLRQARWRWN